MRSLNHSGIVPTALVGGTRLHPPTCPRRAAAPPHQPPRIEGLAYNGEVDSDHGSTTEWISPLSSPALPKTCRKTEFAGIALVPHGSKTITAVESKQVESATRP